jgi:hypothetical protein
MEGTMKQILFAFLAIVLAFSAVMATSPQPALAVGSDAWLTPGADPALTVKIVNVDDAAKSAPNWLQQFSEGINISKPTQICYPFRLGRYHWVPQILQLTDGVWTKITTTQEYLSGSDGIPSACAAPSAAGTFALFAYYNGPIETKSVAGKLFTVSSWTVTVEPYASGYDVSLILANKVNWKGYYPTATKLSWGIRMCWDGSCKNHIEGSKAINSISDPYAQNFDATIFTDSNMYIFLSEKSVCEFKPFVELQDASDNVLDIIYYEDYADYCVS